MLLKQAGEGLPAGSDPEERLFFYAHLYAGRYLQAAGERVEA